LIIFTFYTLILIGRGWKIKLVVEVVFQIMVIIIELADLSFRAQSGFDDNKNSEGSKAINGVATILRVFMVHRRWNEVYTYCLNEILKQVYMLTDSDEKTSKELLELVVKKLPDEFDYYKLILQKVIVDIAITVKSQPRLSRINQLRKLSMHSGNASTIQKDYRIEMDKDIDKNIYDVVPDDEEIEQIFKWNEVGEDVRFALILSGVEQLDFNIFELKTISGGNELVLIANHLMEINDFYGKLNIIKDRFRKYSMVIQKLYNPVSYHNKTHAADVAQTSYYFLTSCDFYNIGQVSDMEAAVLLISSMVHDTDHPGVNNLYLVATRDKLALRYNDKSVLENHHIAVAFNTMLKSKETCIYENFSNEQFKQYREQMIDLVLATDNANHNGYIGDLKKREACQDFDPSGEDKKIVLSVIIHLADISNPTKPWRLCYKWIDLLFVEFFKQGDKERDKGIPISYLMDRHITNIAKAQGGFIDHFIRPAYSLLEFVMPNISLNMKFLDSNKEQWAILEESYSLENDPNVNAKNEEDIIAESDFDPSDTDSSVDIIQKDMHWRRQSIMVAQKRGTIFGKNLLIRPVVPRMSEHDKNIMKTFTGSDNASSSNRKN
jgi:hypothetical protein